MTTGILSPASTLLEHLQSMAALRIQMDQANRREGKWLYHSGEEFVLRHGRTFRPAPLPRDVQAGLPGMCFANCWTLTREARHGLIYVEGYALSVLPVHHAWLWRPDTEEAIDPTWPDGLGLAYVGVPFALAFVRQFRERKEPATALEDWRHGWPLLAGTVPEEVWQYGKG